MAVSQIFGILGCWSSAGRPRYGW